MLMRVRIEWVNEMMNTYRTNITRNVSRSSIRKCKSYVTTLQVMSFIAMAFGMIALRTSSYTL